MQQVVFRFLGPPEIRHKDQLIKIPRRRSRALLYYLISTHSPQPRERLLTLLCGEVDEESARNTFKTLLAEVRALLRGFDPSLEWIINDGDLLKLNPRAPLWLDTEIFEKATTVTSRNLNQAIDLYRGDFLDGFFLKDAPDFDGWVRSARDHFHRLYLTTLRRLAELYESEDQLDQAITCTQMLLAADPLLEEAYARLMRLYSITGDRIEAIRQYERLCTVLAQELAVKPSSSTQALYEQIARRGALSPKSPPVSSVPTQQEDLLSPLSARALNPPVVSERSPFVGRAKEMEWLHHHLAGTVNQYSLLLLQGEMGMGKTRLLQEVRESIGSSWLILQGNCQEIEQVHPYHALVEALRQGLAGEDVDQLYLPDVWFSQLARLLPDRFPSASLALEYAANEPLILADALAALLNGIARPQRPVLLVLDDLHWADAATLAFLGHAATHLQRGKVFLLCTYCAALAGERLEPLRRSAERQNALAELTLSPLSMTDLQQVVLFALARVQRVSLPARERETLLSWCYGHSEGNPFFASTWLSDVLKQPGLPRYPPDGVIPEPITTLIRHLLAHLNSEARALLTAAAFLGTSFDLLTAAQLLHFAPAKTIVAGEELLQMGIIVETSPAGQGTYTFTHRVVKDVLIANMSPVQRQILQQRAAQTP